MKFKIDRRKWLRGEGSEDSKLLRKSDGLMCCLGQVALQCGIPISCIRERGAPDDVRYSQKRKFPDWILDGNIAELNCDVGITMDTNDSIATTDAQKEAELKRLFKANGDTITFNH